MSGFNVTLEFKDGLVDLPPQDEEVYILWLGTDVPIIDYACIQEDGTWLTGDHETYEIEHEFRYWALIPEALRRDAP